MRNQSILESADTDESGSIGQPTGGIHWLTLFGSSPAADGVKILQRKTDRINHVEATSTGGTRAMLRQSLAHRQVRRHRIVIERRDIRQWRRWRRANEILE